MISFRQLTAILLVGLVSGSVVASNLKNISTRGKVETGDDRMIAGFIVEGTDPMKVSVMALGPTLSNYGIDTPLSDPKMTIKDANGNIVAENDDWNNDPDVIATGETPTSDQESAVVLTLNPGSYTVIVEGVNGVTGTAIVAVNKLGVVADEAAKADDAAKLTGSWFGTARYSVNGQSCQWQLNMTFEGDSTGDLAAFVLSDEIVRYNVNCTNSGQTAVVDPDADTGAPLNDPSYIRFTYQATDGYVVFRNTQGLTFFPQPKGELNFSGDGTGLTITQTIDSNGIFIEYNINLTRI